MQMAIQSSSFVKSYSSRIVTITILVACVAVFAFMLIKHNQSNPARQYERIATPTYFKLDKKQHSPPVLPPEVDGCPCSEAWTYYYSFTKAIDSRQALQDLKAKVREAGYVTDDLFFQEGATNHEPGFSFLLSTKRWHQPQIYVMTNEFFDGRPYDPKHVVVVVRWLL